MESSVSQKGNSTESNNKIVASKYCANAAAVLNKIVEIFTTHSEDSPDELLSKGLRPIAEAAALDRIAIYQICDKKRLGQTYVWAHGKTSSLDKDLVKMPKNPPVLRWLECLSRGECINANVNDMNEDESAFLSQFGVKSIFFVPVFTKGTFWGAVTLEDHTNYRYFDEDCLDVLRFTAHLCANVFIRAEMEHAVIEISEYNRILIKSAPIGLTVFDEELCIIECNDAIAELLKTTKRHYIEHFYDYSPEFQPDGEKSADQTTSTIKRALDGEAITIEWNHLSRLGEIIPFEITLIRIRYGDRYTVLAYQYDLSNIKKMEALTCEARELTNAVTGASPFPYVMFDEDLRVIDCNNAAIELLRSPDKQYLLDHYWDHFSPEYQPDGGSSRSKGKDVFKTPVGGKVVYEWLHQTFYGEPIPTENTLTPVIYKGKKTVISFKYDLRNTKALMEDIREKSEELRDALKQMTAASEAKGTFLSNMSHEMRTPLNTIGGMATIGKNSSDLERKDYALGKIEEASRHLLGVINDVLDMSKIEANKLELITADFSFERTLKKAVNAIYFRVEQKQQKFQVRVDGEIPNTLAGDDQRLTQVILNLLTNAVKFTPEGGSIQLHARLLEERGGINKIAVEVSDTGIGITSEHQERLFHAFEQADNSTSRRFGGTGLGLAISKRIVEMMGGAFSVVSEPEKGSAFTFTFYAARGKDNSSSLLDPSVHWENVRILVVDDDTEALSYFSEMLKFRGIQCDTAISGEDALKWIEETGAYDVYFVDWKMPNMNGIELARKIKALQSSRRKKSVVIMISTAEWVLVHDEAMTAGVDKYLLKPLFASDIVNCLNDCVGLSGAGTSVQRQSVRPGELSGCHILLAEDVEINREILLTLMEHTGAEMDCAVNGLEAFRMVQENPEKYDLVFMDIQMPEMDGLEATRRIRAFETKRSKEKAPENAQQEKISRLSESAKKNVPENAKQEKSSVEFAKQTPRLSESVKRIPIIAMTANVFREDIEKCRDAGMNDHLGKPLDMEEVMKKIRKYWTSPRKGRTVSYSV